MSDCAKMENAVRVYARKNKVSMREIAERGGVGRATLYRHIDKGMKKREEARYIRIIDGIVSDRLTVSNMEKTKRKSNSIANFNSDGRS